VLARHNVNNEVGFTGVTVYDGSVELIRFGLNPSSGNTAVYVQFGVNTGSINLGTELRGQRLKYTLVWDATGAFTLTANRLDGPESGSFSGNWGAGNQVSAFGFNNFNSGSFQDFIFDQIDVVPEPASLACAGRGAGRADGAAPTPHGLISPLTSHHGASPRMPRSGGTLIYPHSRCSASR
jgi:hypothetical protein